MKQVNNIVKIITVRHEITHVVNFYQQAKHKQEKKRL
jgi:hypothetical protein